jgi:hypothetical protein
MVITASASLGLIGRIAGEREHFGQVVVILLADGLEALVVDKVVVTIRQRQAGLSDAGDLLGGVLFVLLNAEAE